MSTRIVLILLCLSLFGSTLPAQSVGIGTDRFKPDASAILELRSDTKGLLIPRLTSDQRSRINQPSTGLLIYQTDVTPGFFYYNGTQWVTILSLNNLPVDDDQLISFDPVNFMLTLENGGSVDLSILRNGRSLESTVDNGDGTITFVYNDGTSFVTSDLRGPKGDRGPAGKDANTLLTGNSSPALALGNDGDLYLDTSVQKLYGPKTDSGWGAGVILIGTAGEDGLDGKDGINGKDGTNGLDGRTIHNGKTDPAAATGNDGDLYINTNTFDFFGPKAAGNWGPPISLVGPKGVDGKDGTNGKDGLDGHRILSGSTNPDNAIGNNGDIYLNTTLFNFFGPKTGGNWGTPVSLVGPKGADGKDGVDGTNGKDGNDGTTLLHATTAPTASLGNEGDFFINTTSSELYGPKSATGWGAPVSLMGQPGNDGKDGQDGVDGADGKDGTNGTDGADGSDGANGIDGKTIYNGTAPPAPVLGNDGDLYLNTASSTLFGPKTGGAWGTGVPLIGASGADGNDGADGKDGLDGSDGSDGKDGTDGRTILNGSINPSVGTGEDGDFFLNTSTQILFGPKTAGAWNSGISLVGVGIQSSADNPDGSITFNFTDGTSFTSQPDGDFSSTNELISQLKLSGKTLQITENGVTQAIDLSTISSTTQITDSDENTTITVDQNDNNDNIIRFIAGGTEALRLNNKTLEFINNLGTVAIGENTAMNNSGAGNVAVGTEAAFQNTSGRFNLALGYRALRQNSTGEGNIAIGYNAGFNETGSNKLYIDNSNTNKPLIWGDFANDITNINGRLGIGVASPSGITNELEVNGSAVMISLTETSDQRFKKNVAELTGSLAKIQQLRGVSFDWKTSEFPQKRFKSGKQIGFIAQEVQQVFPQLVSQSSDGYLAVSYSGMTPVLVEALKEQQAQIQDLQKMILELKAELTALKEKVK